ncbi:excalibur calcium-binding domain-containing protein [Nocardia arizonensis]|uniref:excalibur calcium-binding domain-containing protein n=1 Tax=Nocardia arizonensis TaxID=1141647 RepID=UPI0006D0C932
MSRTIRVRAVLAASAALLLAGAALPALAAAQPSSEQQDQVYYKNCAAVRAAGKAPLYEGEPGYAPHLDRDGDGIACEK